MHVLSPKSGFCNQKKETLYGMIRLFLLYGLYQVYEYIQNLKNGFFLLNSRILYEYGVNLSRKPNNL